MYSKHGGAAPKRPARRRSRPHVCVHIPCICPPALMDRVCDYASAPLRPSRIRLLRSPCPSLTSVLNPQLAESTTEPVDAPPPPDEKDEPNDVELPAETLSLRSRPSALRGSNLMTIPVTSLDLGLTPPTPAHFGDGAYYEGVAVAPLPPARLPHHCPGR